MAYFLDYLFQVNRVPAERLSKLGSFSTYTSRFAPFAIGDLPCNHCLRSEGPAIGRPN